MELIQGIVDECDQYSNSSLMQIILNNHHIEMFIRNIS